MSEREATQDMLAVDLQLAADVRAMRIDGLRRDAHLPGDLLAGFVLRDPAEDRPFVRRQQAQARDLLGESLHPLHLADEIARHRRSRVMLARGDGSDASNELRRGA